MYKNQKGCLFLFTNGVAIVLLMFTGISGAYFLSQSMMDAPNSATLLEYVRFFLLNLFVSFLPLLIFLPHILFLGGLLPEIRMSKNGIRYRFLGLFTGFVKWNEIEDVIDLKKPKNYKAILLNRPGFILLNGLWLQSLYGIIFIYHADPIILISPEMEECDRIIEEIKRQISLGN